VFPRPGRRNETRTDKTYNIGRKYLRRKKAHGGDRKSEKIKGQKLPLDRTADDVATEENCSPRHVKN
jgi:hypothetical protein